MSTSNIEGIPGTWVENRAHHGAPHPDMPLFYFCVDADSASGFSSMSGHVTREQFDWLCARFEVANPLEQLP